ncbi:hypothetical protein QJQ45_018271 [Haematococcus lacustris]|nr:hypothetical protein QJQ45_018271 [Haematococcus lacustris]
MGAEASRQYAEDVNGGGIADHQVRTQVARVKAIVGGGGGPAGARSHVPKMNGKTPEGKEHEAIVTALQQLLLFNNLDKPTQRKIVSEMYEKPVVAGEILIQQGEMGLSASQLYVVKSGKFEVLEKRKNVMFKVNTKAAGDCFGEISLMYNCPRSATVAATTDAIVWVLDRDTFRHYVQAAAEDSFGQVELFMNSVPLLNGLSREQKLQLVDAFSEEVFEPGAPVIREGEAGDKFYIVKEGEAVVVSNDKEVNRLFKADFFGEQALLNDEPRKANVRASGLGRLTVLSLDRTTFVNVLGPLQDIMAKEKSAERMPCSARHPSLTGGSDAIGVALLAQTVNQRMAKLKPKSSAALRRPAAKVHVRYTVDGETKTVVALGHLDEVQELKRGGSKITEVAEDDNSLVIAEGAVLGEGAFSRVVKASEETTGRQFAMKRMTKSAALQCPEHVYCEQIITRNMAHPFCIRQYASFQDSHHLYFLFDLMPGGDLMDVLVAEAKVIKYPMPEEGSLRQGCLAQKVKMWQGFSEELARFYVASVVLALEYLHENHYVFRDLKPENVLIDAQGYAKLGDFGFAKQVELGGRTYTFCGTPGYVAPENIMGRGYGHSVDWWTLGVLMYVLLTARQPFTSPKTQDPMEVMRRIVDERWPVRYPPYMSTEARDLISRLLERKPVRRLGCLQARARDVKAHPWFKGFDWDALSSRRMPPPRRPKDEDSSKRKSELETSYKADERCPAVTPEEKAEWERVFRDF